MGRLSSLLTEPFFDNGLHQGSPWIEECGSTDSSSALHVHPPSWCPLPHSKHRHSSSLLATAFSAASENGKARKEKQATMQDAQEMAEGAAKDPAKEKDDKAIAAEAAANAPGVRWVDKKSLGEIREDQAKLQGAYGGPRMIRPGPRQPMPCIGGTDYTPDCPRGWAPSTSIFGKTGDCKPQPPIPGALPHEQWHRPKGCSIESISPGLSDEQKQDLEFRCDVEWPCAGGGGRKPDYEPRHDTICPMKWTYNVQTGDCDAPRDYNGHCARSMNLLGYTPGMKAQFAESCKAKWPLIRETSDDPTAPVVSPLRLSSEAKKLPPTEEEIARDPAKFMNEPDEDNPLVKQALAAEKKKQGPLYSRENPSNAAWAKCEVDYDSMVCPVNWTIRSGKCVPPYGYRGSCPRSGVDLSRFTAGMKKAFVGHCSPDTTWPCKGEFFETLQSSMIPATGAAAIVVPSIGALFL